MKKRRKNIWNAMTVLVLFFVCAGLTACSSQIQSESEDSSTDTIEETTQIILSDSGSTVSGHGASVKGNKIQITEKGSYEITGDTTDEQIYVNASDSDTIILIFDNATIINTSDPALDIENTKETRLILADDSNNLLQSGTSMPDAYNENASEGTLFSRDNLTISGNGSLTVNGYINDGIHCNDDITIENGNIEINAVHHAIKVNNLLTIQNGTFTLNSKADGINSEEDILISDGNFLISSEDDGIHADTDLKIENGTIDITNAYEGIEANHISVEGGDISIVASDDGFNACNSQNDTQKMPFGNNFGSDSDDSSLTIDDGDIYINSDGDGLDSNGSLTINGGTIIVDGPANSANGAIDAGTENGGSCTINGGTILAIGASGMAEGFSDQSAQASFRITLQNPADAGSDILISDASGNELFSHTSAKSFSSVVFSSPDVISGSDYVLTVNDESFSFTQNGTVYKSSSGSRTQEQFEQPDNNREDAPSALENNGPGNNNDFNNNAPENDNPDGDGFNMQSPPDENRF